jgi:Spy/CpxP family protein refolding chaperone
MTRIFKVTAVIAMLLASTAAFAQGPGGFGMGHRGGKGGLPPIPDLTSDQKQKIADLKAAAVQQAAPIHEQIVVIRKAIRALWTADALDRATIASKQSELDGLVVKMKAIWTEFFLQLHDVLTPAQRTWLAQHGPGHFGKFGHHGAAFDAGAEQGYPGAQ